MLLLGVLLVSLVPLLLTLLDVIVDRGAVIEYGSVKINFSQVSRSNPPGFTVPVNIGVRGQAVTDNSRFQEKQSCFETQRHCIAIISTLWTDKNGLHYLLKLKP